MTERAHIALGSNLGDRVGTITAATAAIDALPRTRVAARSRLHETWPVGKTDQPAFVNAVVAADTDLTPEDLMQRLLEIEREMGRVRLERWGPRVIDLDLLTHGATVCTGAALTLPHPRMRERHFVLVPLIEVAPDLRDPLTGEPYREIVSQLPAVNWGTPLADADA